MDFEMLRFGPGAKEDASLSQIMIPGRTLQSDGAISPPELGEMNTTVDPAAL